MTFARVLKEAGFSKTELAELYGVSRQTIHTWAAPSSGPREGSYTARMADTITATLLAVVAKKLLPLAAMSKDARRKRVERMAATLQNLKPAPIK